jgi:hypothetical protein
MGIEIEEEKADNNEDGYDPNPKLNVHAITSRNW